MKNSRRLVGLALVVLACLALQGCDFFDVILSVLGLPTPDFTCSDISISVSIGNEVPLGNFCNDDRAGVLLGDDSFTIAPPTDGFTIVWDSAALITPLALKVTAPAGPGAYTFSYTLSHSDGSFGVGSLHVAVVGVGADLEAVSMTAAPNPATVGGPLTYSILVANNGPNTATGVLLSDMLPQTVTFVSATPSTGSCRGTTTVSCALGTLAINRAAQVIIVVTPTQAGSIVNTASVGANEFDPNSANNTAQVQVTVGLSAFTLTVTNLLLGSGSVSGPGINCGTVCVASYASGTTVVLVPQTQFGPFFASWQGCDSIDPQTNNCTVLMNGNKTVSAVGI